MNPYSPRRKHVGGQSRSCFPGEEGSNVPSALSSLFAPSLLASSTPTTTIGEQTEIHWNPPPPSGSNSTSSTVKRHDPSTPPPTGSSFEPNDVALRMKTRRLLPPSRRVDDGDDEVGIDSPPHVVRKSRTSTRTKSKPPQPTTNTTTKYSVAVATKAPPNRSTQQITTKPGIPVESSTEDLDTFEAMPPDSPGSRHYMLRVESIRSMASKSMASHSTSAELDFYLRRCHTDDSSSTVGGSISSPNKHLVGTGTLPKWIPGSPQRGAPTSPSSFASPSNHNNHNNNTTPLHQRRRLHMLAKSAGHMLRSRRPVWDRTESMHSMSSQASSLAWSTSGASTRSRASSSRKSSLASWNNCNSASRTPTPPDPLVRMTSNGTTGTFMSNKPRPMVTSPHPVVMECAHRPVATSHRMEKETSATTITTSNKTTTTTTAATTVATERLSQMELLDDDNNNNNNNNTKSPLKKQPSLLDDDDAASDLWKKKPNKPSPPPLSAVVGPPPLTNMTPLHNNDNTNNDQDTSNTTMTNNKQQEDDNNANMETLGESWEPQPGGSFMVYRRTH